MRVTNYCNKTLALAACALILLGNGTAWAGQSDNQQVVITNYGFTTEATGSLVAARYSQDATQYISCQVSAAVSNNTLEMSCEARDALGNTFSCRSDESAHVTAVLAMSPNSTVTFDDDHPEAGHCGNLRIGTHSDNLLPVAQ